MTLREKFPAPIEVFDFSDSCDALAFALDDSYSPYNELREWAEAIVRTLRSKGFEIRAAQSAPPDAEAGSV